MARRIHARRLQYRPNAAAAVPRTCLDIACRRGLLTQQFMKEVKLAVTKTPSSVDSRRQYYKIQSLQTLREKNNQVSVPIWIECFSWGPRLDSIKKAIKNINFAAPGLHLEITSTRYGAKIIIIPNEKDDTSFTEGNILTCSDRTVAIHLAVKNDMLMERTTCHELLHALGFGHEHQRQDRDSFVVVPDRMDLQNNSAYFKKEHLLGITPHDPFSIMIYPEQSRRLSRCPENPAWSTKPTTEITTEMSELDKVALNNLYTPCRGPDYSPTKGDTGLWYCGRFFGNQTTKHDGHCGPGSGPNCPACRVLKSDMVESLWKKGKWQGWTGVVYCGRDFVEKQEHDVCGPDIGLPCHECLNELSCKSLKSEDLFDIVL